MRRISMLLLGTLIGCLLQAKEGTTPVLLELFTSEGCSSCPPADQLLAKLDRTQPIAGAELIVLSEHVDYWNSGGWMDPYSSKAFSQRQQHYAEQLHSDDLYTPQLVIDGRSQVVGSDWSKAKAAIEQAKQARKLKLEVKTSVSGTIRNVVLTVSPEMPMAASDVYLALAEDTAEKQVKAGENAGRHLAHTAVVYSLSKVGKTSPKVPFSKSIDLPEHSQWGGATRVIAFLQDPRSGQILGVSEGSMPNTGTPTSDTAAR